MTVTVTYRLAVASHLTGLALAHSKLILSDVRIVTECINDDVII
jgi:hypothetical protein